MDTPKGFLFSVAAAGIKKPGRNDMALILSEQEALAQALFTTNRVKAAPVKLDMLRMRHGTARAVVVNSGNANACNGPAGMQDAMETSTLLAEGLNIPENKILVSSTGVIGVPLPMDRIRKGVSMLVENLGKATLEDVAKAIMTTDTFHKMGSRKIKIGRQEGIIAGICKGAGMIEPRMATLLCYFVTDIAIEKAALKESFAHCIDGTFNHITVDGDTSTNDTALILANGAAQNEPIARKTKEYEHFVDALAELSYELSRMVVQDGEGATKVIVVEIEGARNDRDAKKFAMSVAKSPLVKTAVYGNDPNVGRIMAALGYAGAYMEESRVDVYVGKVKVIEGGIATGKTDEAASQMRSKEVLIRADMKIGKSSARVLTCDLTEGYIKINAEYTT